MLAEAALVFVVFFVQGATPVPEVNEPYYLGKTIHFWNPQWAAGDFFLDSDDTHKVFYFTLGWLSLWLSPLALAWVGRLLTWGLLAWAWQRMSVAVLPRRWFSVLTAAVFACLLERCHMAGEWVIGGFEAKGFAYVLVFLGVEAMLRDRWNRAWLFLGGAASFHVLVGGWSVVAAAFAWLCLGKDRPPPRSMWPGLAGGLLLALPGLIPSLRLTWGVEPETVRLANQIYVFERLAHHLAPTHFPPAFIVRFSLLLLFWLILCRMTPADACGRRLRGFVGGAVVIAAVGVVIGLATAGDRALAAGLLRFYWFRLSDVAVPLGVALGGAVFINRALRSRPATGRRWLVVWLTIAGLHLGSRAVFLPVPNVPPADRLPDYAQWRGACDWVAHCGEIPPEARFLTPRMSQTFKWYTGRSEVVTWKEIPQDARSIVRWWRRVREIHYTGNDQPDEQWYPSLAQLGAARGVEHLRRLGKKYEAGYLLTTTRPSLDLDVLYKNNSYAVYRLKPNQRPPISKMKEQRP